MSTAQQIGEQMLADLNSTKARIVEAEQGITQVEGKIDELLQEAESRLEQVKAKISQSIQMMQQRQQTTEKKYGELQEALKGLQSRFVELTGQAQTSTLQNAQAWQNFTNTMADGERNTRETTQTFVQTTTSFEAVTHQLGNENASAHQHAAELYHTQYSTFLQDRLSAAQEISATSLDIVQSDLNEKLLPAIDNFKNSTRQKTQDFDARTTASVERIDTSIRDQINDFDRAEHERWKSMSDEAQSLAGTMTGVGETLTTVTRTAGEGVEMVCDAMQTTNVGLNTAIGICNNASRLMDEIISAI